MAQKTKTCKECGQRRRITQFSLIRKIEDNKGNLKEIRDSVCRLCNYDGLYANEPHKILREAYRNYLTFKQFVTDTGRDVLEYRVPKERGSDEYVLVSVSFTDLERALKSYNDEMRREGTVLSKRKEQAFYLNVIRDMLQRDVAEIMGITTVSVGQYVEQGMMQLCDYYFGEMDTTKSEDSKA
jgi:predicted DNA-binding ribbon-helix-helix protein